MGEHKYDLHNHRWVVRHPSMKGEDGFYHVDVRDKWTGSVHHLRPRTKSLERAKRYAKTWCDQREQQEAHEARRATVFELDRDRGCSLPI